MLGVEVRHVNQHVSGNRRGLGFVRGEPAHHNPALDGGRAGLQWRDLDGIGGFPGLGGPRFAAALFSGAEMGWPWPGCSPLRHAVVKYEVGATAKRRAGPLPGPRCFPVPTAGWACLPADEGGEFGGRSGRAAPRTLPRNP